MRLPHLRTSLFLGLAACTAAPPPEGAPPSPLVERSASISAPPPPAEPTSASTPAPSAPAAETPALAPRLEGLDAIVLGAIAREEVAGAVVEVVRGGEPYHHEAYGLRRREPLPVPMRADTVFDMASITKAICTGPAIMALVEEKKLRLGDRVSRYLPGFAVKGKEAITLEQLLLHTSGLPADNALTDYDRGPEQALSRIYALPLEAEPGARFTYSDLGYILLGAVIEKVSGQALDAFVQSRFFAPLGMRDTGYRPGPALIARAAPTEERAGTLLQGSVHDPRAARLGGVAGHAGLFSTAADLGRFARMLLGGGALDGIRVLSEASVKQMTRPHPLPEGGSRGLGWDIDTRYSGNRGELKGGYGHTGFTGTSIWIEPSTGTAVIVLTSRLYPDGKGDPRRLRREVASFVARLGARKSPAPEPALPTTGTLLTGIDVLEQEGFARLRGRKIGLVTHAAAVDQKGRRTVDVLRGAPGLELVSLFSPEHGLRGDQDSPVADGHDEASGLVVHSLYGAQSRPSDAALAGIDTLVYDLQDVGARFYTYESTLGYLLETAAAKKLKVLVLDRPNPLGGVQVEGPMRDPGPGSFTSYHPLPIRHGMTVGELARLFNGERALGADLQVVALQGWSRADTWDRTGLPFHNPSPNLRSFTEVLLYPGVALLETTNLSVGRGTDRPFERVGAPWVDGPRLASALAQATLPGVSFTATTFTPTSSSFAGQRCAGVEIHLGDRRGFDPVRTGLAIAAALRRLHPGEWQSKGLLTLLGNRAAFEAIERGEGVDEVALGWRAGLADFAAVRARYLLYPGAR
jgi:uncharacterized protein YbbC (DUF1343 family)/CubicO group peptidase (beta-lactamase class C family)